MAQGNQDIAYNNSLANVEALLTTMLTNTAEDWSSISEQVCDVQLNNSSIPIIKTQHYKSGVLQTTTYQTLSGSPYTVTGTLGNCTSVAAPDYSSLLTTGNTNTNATKTSVDNVTTALSSTNTTLSTINTGISAINSKLNEGCAGTPLKVTICNPTTADFTATNGLLTTISGSTTSINTGVGDVNTKLSSALTKIDTTNTQLAAVNAKLNETCSGSPIKVEVCNQPSTFVDFSSTNTILSNILTQDTATKNNTAAINSDTTALVTALGTANTSLSTIANKLVQGCGGTPLNVNICNPSSSSADFTSTNAILTNILTQGTSTATNTGDTSTKLTATNTKLDTANTNLTSIYNKLNAACNATPINVTVCNPTANTADFTSTNAILTNILSANNTINSDTTAINTKLATTNTTLSTIAGVLTQSCAGTPLKVSVCNQIDLTTVQTSLASIDSKSSTLIASNSTIATNSGTIVTSNATIATNTANTKTSVDAVTTAVNSLATQLTTASTNHVVVDNFPGSTTNYNTNQQRVVTTISGALTLAANTYHSISINVLSGSATINYSSVTATVPEGYTNNMEATTTLANAITITAVASGDTILVTTIS